MAFCRTPVNELLNFDLRLWDQHTRYDGRWSDEQLKAIVERLGLAAAEKSSYAIASFARSLVLDAKTDNRGVHYSRDRNKYADRYLADGDPYNTYFFKTMAADWLKANYRCEHLIGTHIPNNPGAGRESVEYCSLQLMDKIGDLVDPLEPRALATQPETIILRDSDKKNTPYCDTPETRGMRKDLRAFNDHLAQREIRRQGEMVEIPLLRRIFNLVFERGGRLYCWGESYQGLSKKERAEFIEVIDGVAQSFVEIDFSAHHFRLAYPRAGKKMPPGDPYDIPGFDRDLVKLAGLISFNAQGKKDAAGAVMGEAGCSYGEAKAVIKAVRRKHHRIKDYFWSDAGARLMRTDSDMSMEIMKQMMARTGRCPLPMHDSFLVPACDAEVLAQVMEEVAAEYGVRAELSTTGTNPPATEADPNEENNNTPTPIPTLGMADPPPHLRISPSPQTVVAASQTLINAPPRTPKGAHGLPRPVDNPTGFAQWLKDRTTQDNAVMEHAVMPEHLKKRCASAHKDVGFGQVQASVKEHLAQHVSSRGWEPKCTKEELAAWRTYRAGQARHRAKIVALADAICRYVGANPGENQSAVVAAMREEAGVVFSTAEIAIAFNNDVREAIKWAEGRLRREKDGRATRHYLVTE